MDGKFSATVERMIQTLGTHFFFRFDDNNSCVYAYVGFALALCTGQGWSMRFCNALPSLPSVRPTVRTPERPSYDHTTCINYGGRRPPNHRTCMNYEGATAPKILNVLAATRIPSFAYSNDSYNNSEIPF